LHYASEQGYRLRIGEKHSRHYPEHAPRGACRSISLNKKLSARVHWMCSDEYDNSTGL